jgi:putative ABC transport system substrate-binding protein
MNWREFIRLLAVAAVAWPLAAQAQQAAMPVVGYLSARAASDDPQLVTAFRRGLGETGHVEGRNTAIDYRWADGRNDRLPGLAADLVRRQVNVLAAFAATATAAAKAATTTIPIVFQVAVDPVEAGLVDSLAGPRGNLTGVTTLSVEVGPKRLALLHEVVPQAKRMALLVNPTSPLVAEPLARDLQVAARSLGVELQVARASTEAEIEAAVAMLAQARVGAVLIGPDAFFATHTEQIAAAAIRHRIAAIYQSREFAAAGGLMSYGGDLKDAYRLVGVYTGRILKGEKLVDLPVQQSTKLALIINLKTAKTLGIEVPLTLQTSADEVIE